MRSNLPVNADMPFHIKIQSLNVLIQTPRAVLSGRIRTKDRKNKSPLPDRDNVKSRTSVSPVLVLRNDAPDE